MICFLFRLRSVCKRNVKRNLWFVLLSMYEICYGSNKEFLFRLMVKFYQQTYADYLSYYTGFLHVPFIPFIIN